MSQKCQAGRAAECRKGVWWRPMPCLSWPIPSCAAVILAAAVSLAGCGSGKSPIGPIMAARHPPPLSKPIVKGPTLPTDMVGALGDGKPGAARVSVRFDLKARPQVAQPLDLNIVILPSAGLDRVYGKVEADDGLELVSGADIAPIERPAEDVPISHSIRLVPQREGLLTLRAVISADSGGQPASQTFSIPLIAGAGAAGPQAGAGTGSAGDAAGHPPPTAASTTR
jgi:hypothetical protein